MTDFYDDLIVQFRARDEAARKLADLCRKKDLEIRKRVNEINNLNDEIGSLLSIVEDWLERMRRKLTQ